MLGTRAGLFCGLAVFMVFAALVPVASAAFMAEITLVADVPDPDRVPPGTSIAVTAICDWTAAPANPGDNITRIQLNWSGSSPELDLPHLAGPWAWNADTSGINALGDADMADAKVNRQGAGITPGTRFEIGTLSFLAPTAPGTYTVNLTSGSLIDGSATVIADGTTYLYEGSDLGLGSFTFTVPEPASLALLTLGAMAIVRRRRGA